MHNMVAAENGAGHIGAVVYPLVLFILFYGFLQCVHFRSVLRRTFTLKNSKGRAGH